MNKVEDPSRLSPAPFRQSGPEPAAEQEAEPHGKARRYWAYAVVGLLYLSFVLHLANSEAVKYFLSEVNRLFEKFVF